MVPSERTASLWDFLNSSPQVEKYRNLAYDSSLDDPTRRDGKADMGVLIPNPKDVRFWYELYGRTDEEMNGRIVISQGKDESEIPTTVEGLNDDSATSRGEILPTPEFPSLMPSPSPSLSSSRTVTTEGLSSTFQGLWSSLPDLPQRVAEGFTGVGVSTNLKAVQPTFPVNNASQGRARNANPTDIFSSTGVKSVWGKLSSNATAAFSAVQEAYDGVAKDLRGPSRGFGEGESPGKISELQPRDGDGSQSLSTTSGSSYNPWDSVKPQKSSVSALPTDNPWSTARSRSPRQLGSAWDAVGTGSLDADLASARLPRERNTTVADQRASVPLAQPSDEQEQKRAMINTDPLGVGLL